MAKKPFFQSQKFPHAIMNKHGVVLVPNGHPDAATYYGKSFEYVPLKSGKLAMEYAIREESYDFGYTHEWKGYNKIYKKPTKSSCEDINREWNSKTKKCIP